jgi:hypothetical protein
LLGSELIDIAGRQSVLADRPQKEFVGLQQSGLLDEVIVAFNSLYFFGLLFHAVDHG